MCQVIASCRLPMQDTDVKRDSLNQFMRVIQQVSLRDRAFQKSLILLGVLPYGGSRMFGIH
ncbi:MAG: hypothetical protein PF503_08180 [Desulfobacula sp.]|nr:hypothetical protein [Desulfobacula sp.]